MENDNGDLLDKYNRGLCTEKEKQIVESWFLQWEEHGNGLPREDLDEISKKVWASLPGPDAPLVKPINWSLRIISIAAIFAIGIFSIWIFYGSKSNLSRKVQIVNQSEIPPGGNKATLTLSNGQTITLSDAKTGVVIKDTKIAYNDGTDVIEASSRKSIATTNRSQMTGITLSTPRGGIYQIVLPDNTKVWLNAASSLTYKTILRERGIVRIVKLIGEAYFEVAPDKTRPFIVETDEQSVAVLGTHFNINGYADGNETKTTLLEGSLKVTNLKSKQSSHLQPDQEAIVNGDQIKINRVDPQESIAWKKGEFYFNNQSLETAMKQISRWYNVEVVFKNAATGKQLVNGAISKFENVSEIMKMLELTGEIKFKIEGRRIVIMN